MQDLLLDNDILTFQKELNKQENLVIPGNNKVIAEGAIKDSGSLKQLTFEKGVSEIRQGAVTSCINLERVVIPETIVLIGEGNFEHCKNLVEIEAPTESEGSLYWSCDGVLYQRIGGGKSELFYYPPAKKDKLYQFPENVRCGFAGSVTPFREATALKALQIPSRWLEGSVTNLKLMFGRNSSIKELHVRSDALPKIISSDALNLCLSMHLLLSYNIGGSKNTIDPSVLDLSDIDASENGKEIPLARVRAAQALVDGETEPFVEWAIDALKKKKETAILVKLIQKHGACSNTLKLIADGFSSRTSKKGIKSAEAENYADYLLQSADYLEHKYLKIFYDQCVAEKLDTIIQRLENNPRTRMLLSGEKESVQNEIEAFVVDRYHETDEIKWLSKYDLSGVKYSESGNDVPEYIVRFVLACYTSQLEKMPRQIGGYHRDAVELSIYADADKVANCFEKESFLALLNKLSNTDSNDLKTMKFVVAAARYEDSEWVKSLINKCSWWSDWSMYGASGRAAIIAAHGAIMLNDTKEAAQYAEKNKLTRYYADIRGITEKDVIDRINSIAYEIDNTMMVADGFGLSSNGIRQMTNDGIEAYIDSSIKLALRDKEGNAIKSIRGDKNAQEAYASLKKEIYSFVKERKKDIFKLYFRNDALSHDIWFDKFAAHPVLKPLTKAVIWSDETGTSFILTDEGVIGVDGSSYSPQGKIRPAHVLDMNEADIEKWRRYLLDNKKSLLIEQVWEPIIAYNPRRISDRYSDIKLTNKERSKLKSTLKARNIDIHSDVNEGKFDPYQGTRVFSDNNTMNLGNSMTITYIIDPDTKDIIFGSDLKLRRAASKYEVNAILFELDKFATKSFIEKDEAEGLNRAILDAFSVAQIIEFIDFASSNKSVNCTAVLQEYRNEKYPEYDAFSEFVID